MTNQMTDVTRPLNSIYRNLDNRNLRGFLPRWRLGGNEVDWVTAEQTTGKIARDCAAHQFHLREQTIEVIQAS